MHKDWNVHIGKTFFNRMYVNLESALQRLISQETQIGNMFSGQMLF